MKNHSLRVISRLFLIAATSTQLSAVTTEWVYHKTDDGSHPDGNEQQLVWLMNRARANPAAEGAFLSASGDPGIVNGINFFRVNMTTLQSEFNALAAKPPGAFDRRLYEGSKAHSQYLITNDVQDHTGQFDRITSAGFSFTAASVSVYSYSASALQAHGALNIDWGSGTADGVQTGRGHRSAIMSGGTSFWSNVGFAMLPDNDINTGVGPLVFSGASEFLIPPHHSERLTDLSRDHSRSSALICNELRSKTTLVVSGKVQRSFRGIRNSEPTAWRTPAPRITKTVSSSAPSGRIRITTTATIPGRAEITCWCSLTAGASTPSRAWRAVGPSRSPARAVSPSRFPEAASPPSLALPRLRRTAC